MACCYKFLILAFMNTFVLVSCGTAPRLNPLSFPDDLIVGSRASLICVANLGDQPLDFQWYKDGKKHSSEKIQQLGPFVSELILEPLERDDSANYTCTSSNEYGKDEVSASLLVKAPPIWVKEPQDSNVPTGAKVSLDCFAEGVPSVKAIWKRRSPILGTLEDIVLSERIRVLPNNTLLVNRALKSDDGQYICEVGNGVGDDIHKSVQLIVYDFPVVQRITDHLTVEHGRMATLTCLATGDGPLLFMWKKNDVPIKIPHNNNRFEFLETAEVDGIRFSLVIGTTVMSDGGLYSCIAQNPYGSDEKDVRLYLVERPHAPEDIEVVDIWSRSARIRWAAPSDGNSPITNYTIEFWTQSGMRRNISVRSATTSAILEDLSPFTSYKFVIWALNNFGAGDPSEQLQFSTAKEEPSAPPADIKVGDKGSNFVQLSWKPPPHEYWNGNIIGYYIGYKQSSSTLPYTFNTMESTDENIYYVLRGLKKGARYHIVVKAYNEIGSGPSSQEVSVRTHNHEPPPRPSLLVKSIGSTHIQLYWPLTEEMKTSVRSYSLNFRKESDKWQEIIIPDPHQNTYTLTNLDSGLTYQVYLMSKTSVGTSEPSDTATVHTMAESLYHAVPSQPPSSQAGIDEFTQTLYVVVPITVSAVIIVIVIVVACVYVYSKRPIRTSSDPYADLPPDKNFTYMATIPRQHSLPPGTCGRNNPKQGSPSSLVPLTRHEVVQEEPIYESVTDEIRCKMRQKIYDDEFKVGSGTIV